MAGAVLTLDQKAAMGLIEVQIGEINWSDDEGDEPAGG